MQLFRKLFLSGEWNIAFRKRKEMNDTFNYDSSFISLPHSETFWYADPMIFEADNKFFLFCEAFDRREQIGKIGLFELIDEKWKNFSIILENNYHMSYPCVFYFEGKYYMIPETEENCTLQLYEAEEFPYKWEKRGNLVEGAKLADSTVFIKEKKCYILGYSVVEGRYARIFLEANLSSCTTKILDSKFFNENIIRPAGYFFKSKDCWYRPSQDCRREYGKGIIINRILNFDKFEEQYVYEFDNKMIIVDGKRGVDRVHTYTLAGEYEVIDFNIYRFDLFKRLKVFKRIYLKKKRDKDQMDKIGGYTNDNRIYDRSI